MKLSTVIVALALMGLQDPPKQEKVQLVPYRSDQPGAKVGAGMEETPAETPAQAEIRRKLESTKMSVVWNSGEALSGALTQIADHVEINAVLDGSADPGATVDLRLTGMSAAAILDLMTAQVGARWVIGDQHIRVMSVDKYRESYAVLRTYDLRDLLFIVKDFPGPTMTPPVDDGGLSGATFTPPEESEGLSQDYITDLVRMTIDPASWEYPANSISIMGGAMFVRTLPETHAQVEKFIQRLRQRSQIQVRTEARVVAVSEEMLAELTKGGPTLDAAAESKLKAAELLGAAELLCFNSQRTHVLRANVQSFTASYDAAIGGANVALTPKQGRVYDGVLLDVRPVAGADRRSVTLELHFEMNDVKGFKTTAAPGGSIKEPDVLNYKLTTTITVPSGDAVIVGTMGDYATPPAEGAPKLRSVLIVRATILGLEQR